MNAEIIDKTHLASLQPLLNKIAAAIALLEQAEDKLQLREQAVQEHESFLELKLKETEAQIGNLRQSFISFQQNIDDSFDELGLARLRLILKQGEEHLQAIQDVTEKFNQRSEEVFEKLDRHSIQASRQLAQALKAFDAYEIRKISDESCYQIKKASISALRQIAALSKRLLWKTMGFAFSIALLVTMVMGMYINDEWPWETHAKIVQQKNLAQAVISNWSSLSTADQQNIARNLTSHG